MAKYEIDLCRRRLLIDGQPALDIPKTVNPDDEWYEVHHIDEVQIAAIEQQPLSIEPSDLKKVTFKIDPNDKFSAMQRMIQSLGAHTAKVGGNTPMWRTPPATSPATPPVKPEFEG